MSRLWPFLHRPTTYTCAVCGKPRSYRHFTTPVTGIIHPFYRALFAYAVRDVGSTAIVMGEGLRAYAVDEQNWRCLLEQLLIGSDSYLSTHVEMIHNDQGEPTGVVLVTLPPQAEPQPQTTRQEEEGAA